MIRDPGIQEKIAESIDRGIFRKIKASLKLLLFHLDQSGSYLCLWLDLVAQPVLDFDLQAGNALDLGEHFPLLEADCPLLSIKGLDSGDNVFCKERSQRQEIDFDTHPKFFYSYLETDSHTGTWSPAILDRRENS